MSNDKKTTSRLGNHFIRSGQNVIGWRSIRQHGQTVLQLGKEVLTYTPKGQPAETFAEIESRYSLRFDDAKRNHALYAQSFFVLTAVASADLLLLLRSLVHEDFPNAVACVSMFGLFGIAAARYAYLCFMLRTRNLVPFTEFVRAPSQWIPFWDGDRSTMGIASSSTLRS